MAGLQVRHFFSCCKAMNDHDSIGATVAKVLTVIVLWFGGIKLGDIQAVIGILSGLAVGGYAALQAISLWRREFRDRS